MLQAPKVAADGDRLIEAVEVRAFNHGLNSVDWRSFTHVGKLDGDIELPPEWYETLLARFDAEPRLGIACGQLSETVDGVTRTIPIPAHHVHGALKLYAVDCLAQIGGLQPRLGWDTIDEAYARMRGWSTRSFADPIAIHHRPLASRDGVLRGRARHGACAYITHQGLPGWRRGPSRSAAPPGRDRRRGLPLRLSAAPSAPPSASRIRAAALRATRAADARVARARPAAFEQRAMSASTQPDLSVIVVTHGRPELALSTLRSAHAAAQGLDVQWLVADSGSTDDTPGRSSARLRT